MPLKPETREEIWKYIAISALGIIGGMLTNQISPNRNIVTADQLESAAKSVQIKLDSLDTRMADLQDQVSYVKGQIEAEKRTR